MSDPQELFNHLAARHGGVSALSPIEAEILAAIVKSVAALQAADPAAAPKITDAIAKLTAQLPPPPAQPEPDWSKFNDEQLHCIERALVMIKGEPDPGPQRGPEAKTPVVEKIAALIEVAHLKEKVANLEAQLDALLKLNALLEARLAEEVPA
jgi:hypothetical protein